MAIIRDVVAAGGGVALLFGLYRAWEPAAFIVGGGVVLVLCVCSRLREQRNDRDRR